eukprot:scaffold20005_cov16-Tisochrysis_lutea.AAC.1
MRLTCGSKSPFCSMRAAGRSGQRSSKSQGPKALGASSGVTTHPEKCFLFVCSKMSNPFTTIKSSSSSCITKQ